MSDSMRSTSASSNRGASAARRDDAAANPLTDAKKMGNELVGAVRDSAMTMLDNQRTRAADQIASVSLVIAMKVGEEGRLFGSVTNIQIEKALKAQGVNIDRRKIHLDEPIKVAGDYEVPVRLAADLTVPLRISVVSES